MSSLASSTLAITSPGGVTPSSSQTITGTYAGAAAAGTVVTLDDDGTRVGTAVVARDGTWSTDVVLGHLGANALTARTVDTAGEAVASAPVTLTLAAVLSPPSQGAAAPQAAPVVQTAHPAHGATLSGAGADTTFVFTPHPGQDTITGFGLSGAGADHLSFSSRSFSGLADVLRHTTMSSEGAVIHLSAQDSVTLVGVTKQALRAHPGAFAFHP